MNSKHVLLIDSPLLFREYLKDKLAAEKVSVDSADSKRDAWTKIISTIPQLIIIDIKNSFKEILPFLERKQNDPNAKHIPIIMTGPTIDRNNISGLLPYNVVKYFNKPINFDVFFESIGRILKIATIVDTSPCILETHLNNNIIFIEIAQGLNRDKMQLLKYKLTEIIDQNHLQTPKVILMMTDLSLNFVDGANLEILLNAVTADTRIQKRHIKVLSLDNFTRELIEGHSEYAGIEVATNLSAIMNSLINNDEGGNITDLITDRILKPTRDTSEGTVQTRFYADDTLTVEDTEPASSPNPSIAIIDDDFYSRNIFTQIYKRINAQVDFFDSGTELLAALNHKRYSLIILDLFMPGISGFDLLNTIHSKKSRTPVIIYTASTSREAVMQSLNLGAKTYLIKPLMPEALLQKTVEVINESK